MAGTLVLFTNTENKIEGDCEAEGYTKQLKIESASFNANAVIASGEETGTVFQSGITFMLPAGPWAVQFQQALFHGQDLGEVTIAEVAQALDGDNKKTWKKVREMKLLGAWVESMSASWSGIHSSYTISLQYTDITVSWGDKVAHYNRSEKS